MEIRTYSELIDWTRQLHEHLARCLAECATRNEEERAIALLEYLADHEARIERMVKEFEEKADPGAMRTLVYDYLSHKEIKSHRTCDAHYAELGFDEIAREVFDLHEQIIDMYRGLVLKTDIPEATALVESLLEMEVNQVKRLAKQTGRMDDV